MNSPSADTVAATLAVFAELMDKWHTWCRRLRSLHLPRAVEPLEQAGRLAWMKALSLQACKLRRKHGGPQQTALVLV